MPFSSSHCNFHHAGLTSCSRRKRRQHSFRHWLFLLPLVGLNNPAIVADPALPTASLHVSSDTVQQTHPESGTSYNIADFFETPPPSYLLDVVKQEQQRYLKDKEELQGAIALCKAGSSKCNANVRKFSDMIDALRQVSDRGIQLKLCNAWMDIRFHYDHREAAVTQNDSDHRTLLQAVVDNLVICDELARLKLFVLEDLHFPERDMRWVSEDLYIKGKSNRTGHAVVTVKIDDNVWVLNNQQYVWTNRRLTTAEMLTDIQNASFLETADRQLNITAAGQLFPSTYKFVPVFDFNSTTVGSLSYPPNTLSFMTQEIFFDFPATDIGAVKPVSCLVNPGNSTYLSDLEINESNGLRIMASAFGSRAPSALGRRAPSLSLRGRRSVSHKISVNAQPS